MLNIILPIAVKYELENRETLEKAKFSRLQANSLVDPSDINKTEENRGVATTNVSDKSDRKQL
jgi:hypothetical protein